MTWDRVPLFVQADGAPHSPEVFRASLYASTSGAEGVVGIGDLKVVPTAVPSGNVVVSIGNALILSRDVGGAQQTYAGRNPSVDTQQIAQTGSSGKRSDLVIVRVEDPGMDGTTWDDPDDPLTAQFIFTRIISGVPAGTTRVQDIPGHENDTAITLARIDVPANTGTITSAMIVDLRKVALPRKDRQVNAHAQTAADGVSKLTSKTQAGQLFPQTSSAFTVDVPPWATRMIIIANWSQVQAGHDANGTAYGRLWAQVGADSDPAKRVTQESSWDTADVATGYARYAYNVPDSLYVPAGLRGRTVPVTLRGRRADSTSTGETLVIDAVSGCSVDVEFIETAE